MQEYHKIQTVFHRDPATNHKTLLDGVWSEPEFEYLQHNDWMFTEKVDGTNIRVKWDRTSVKFGARSDDAMIPPTLLERLGEMFRADELGAAFPDGACLYGEGYGAKIQKGGGRYIPTGCSFILFDVMVKDIWLKREDVEDVAGLLGIDVVPIIGRGTLHDAIRAVRVGFKSTISRDAGMDAEGLVIRPVVDMFDRRGRRIITKLKAKDFARQAQTSEASSK